MTATTYPRFLLGLYREHLEEASFLHEQRNSLLSSGAVPWRRIGDFEQRLEAHIDALVIAAEPALELCSERAVVGDAGELFTALSVFCRTGDSPRVAQVLRALDLSDADRVSAVTLALKYELPHEWQTFIEQALARSGHLLPVLAEVCGYRRLPVADVLVDALDLEGDRVVSVLRALGRLGARTARHSVERHLYAKEPAVKLAALLALLRAGPPNSLYSFSEVLSSSERWWQSALVFAGDASAPAALMHSLEEAGSSSSASMLALGALGDLSALPVLHECLDEPALCDAAALALNWITGAFLFEDIFIPEDSTDEELVKGEQVVGQKDVSPALRSDGRPFGEMVRRISSKRDSWDRWWRTARSDFDPKLRWRYGKPFSPEALLGCLCDDRSDFRLRGIAIQELAIRYGCDVPLEIDMPVVEQMCALRQVSAWVATNAPRFDPGRWYFGGALQ